AQRIAEHLPNARELVLAIETENHAEEPVELRALHALAEQEHVLRKFLLLTSIGKIHVATQTATVVHQEVVLGLDRANVVKHRLGLVGVDPKAGDHVNQTVGVDILFVGVATENKFEFRRGHEFANNVNDIVTHNSLCGAKVANSHLDDPAVDVSD